MWSPDSMCSTTHAGHEIDALDLDQYYPPDLTWALQKGTVWSNSYTFKGESKNEWQQIYILLLRYTCNMCLLVSKACFREECREKSWCKSQFHSSGHASFIKTGISSEMNQFCSELAGSLSSSLHEIYSMRDLKECGVHSIDRASHSLISNTKGARSTRKVEVHHRLASLLLTASPHNRYEHSCTFTVWRVQLLLHQTALSQQVWGNTFSPTVSTPSTPKQFATCCGGGVASLGANQLMAMQIDWSAPLPLKCKSTRFQWES